LRGFWNFGSFCGFEEFEGILGDLRVLWNFGNLEEFERFLGFWKFGEIRGSFGIS
jgi:hypothetical protein